MLCIFFLAMFILGISFTCPGGIHMFHLFNASAPSWNLLLLALIEVIVVGWNYGADRLLQNLDEMGMKIHPILKVYWKVCWIFTTPAVLSVLVIFSWINFGHVEYEGYVYPTVIQILGYFITGCTLIWIPIFAIVEINKKCKQGASYSLLHPTSEWGRADNITQYEGIGGMIEDKEIEEREPCREKISLKE